MEERRRENDKNWAEIHEFIAESREYRAADVIRQEYIKKQVDKTNGRVDALEIWKTDIDAKIKERRDQLNNEVKNKLDIKNNFIIFVNICLAIVMAVSAVVMIFKK